ncbi:MAG TPA: alpha/beta hydrolase [Thermoclostridium sp.]|nr:alpha/beta hydrolase [Thermoclostridium sp.]
MIKEGTLKIDNSIVDYVSFGKGNKPMMLLQGLNPKDSIRGAGIGLAYMYRLFSKEYKVYCIDRKRDIPEGYTVDDIANDYSCAMSELGIRDANVLGVSQGGMIAQALAIEHPELVKKIVLGVTLSRNNETLIKCLNNWIHMIKANRYEDFGMDYFVNNYSEQYLKKNRLLLPVISKLMKPKNTERFIRLTESCLTCNTYDRLNEIRCPVFVIGAGQDKVVSGQASVEIAEKLGCRLYMYNDLGHGVYDEAKDFNQKVYMFFKEA